MLDDQVEIIEVGLRDGLQNESTPIPTEVKLQIIDILIRAGVKKIQVTSFVHPKLVPQMSDAEDICANLPEEEGVEFSGLVLNPKGLERAHAAGIKIVDISFSASDQHSRKNANRSLEVAAREFAEMVRQAQSLGLKVRGGIQCAFGCGNEGVVEFEKVIEIVKNHLDLNIDQLALADSAGVANPIQITKMMETILPMAEDTPIVLHLHDTRGLGLANVLAAINSGIRHFDTAFGAMGGCPFIKGATGNIGTEDAIYMLEEMGYRTGIDRSVVAECSMLLEEILGRPLPGKLYRPELNELMTH